MRPLRASKDQVGDGSYVALISFYLVLIVLIREMIRDITHLPSVWRLLRLPTKILSSPMSRS